VNTAGTVVETVFSDPDRLDSGLGLELDDDYIKPADLEVWDME
jgi:hypothetical protein